MYIEIAPEDTMPGDENQMGKLNQSPYGTQDAAMNWQNACSNIL